MFLPSCTWKKKKFWLIFFFFFFCSVFGVSLWLEIHCELESAFLSEIFLCWTTCFCKKAFGLINWYFLNPKDIQTELSCAGLGVYDWHLQKTSASLPGGWSYHVSVPSYKHWPELYSSAHPQPPYGSKMTMTRVWSCLLFTIFWKHRAVKGRKDVHGPRVLGGWGAMGSPQAGAAAGDREGPCGQRPGGFRGERAINPWGIWIWATCQWTPDMFLAASSPSVSL